MVRSTFQDRFMGFLPGQGDHGRFSRTPRACRQSPSNGMRPEQGHRLPRSECRVWFAACLKGGTTSVECSLDGSEKFVVIADSERREEYVETCREVRECA